MLNNPKKRLGFSLIELIVVITIIGVLAALGISRIKNTTVDARNTKRISDLQNLKNAIEAYKFQGGIIHCGVAKSGIINQEIDGCLVDGKDNAIPPEPECIAFGDPDYQDMAFAGLLMPDGSTKYPKDWITMDNAKGFTYFYPVDPLGDRKYLIDTDCNGSYTLKVNPSVTESIGIISEVKN